VKPKGKAYDTYHDHITDTTLGSCPRASSARVGLGAVTVPVAGVGATCTLPLSSLLGGAGLRCGVRSPMQLIAPTTAVVAAMLRKMVE
jgi:hypothetical protein